MAMTSPALLRALALSAALALAGGPAFASLDRARAAQGRGDLRTAQIELRNAVRAAPGDGALRLALAQASLDLGDGDTAEKEARAALERGADPAEATALVIRSLLALGRAREVLREFAEPAADATGALAGQVLAGRAQAQAALDDRAGARRSAEAAVRAAPNLAEARLVMAGALLGAGDRARAEAEVDAALAAAPNNPQALLRKAAFAFERNDNPAAAELVGRVIAAAPGNVMARVQRAEVLMRMAQDEAARADVDAALRTAPGSVPATYLRALLQLRAQDWRGADESLARLGPALSNLPDGLLVLATVKRALNQGAQALDAAQRHVARRPEDPRGARLLAQMDMEAQRFAPAAATLNTLVSRGTADAEAFDMLGRAQLAQGRPREAAEAFRQADALAPGNAGLLSRLAAARLAIGDVAGMAEAANGALRAAPDGPAARLMLAMGAMNRGDLSGAEAELARLDPAARTGEPARLIEGTIKLVRFDTEGARAVFAELLRADPNSVPARIALARVANTLNDTAEADRLLGEALRRDPRNVEATNRLAAAALSRGPRAAPARAALEAALAANPAEAQLATAVAMLHARLGEFDRAAALLQSEALRAVPGQGAMTQLRLSEVRVAQERWGDAEAAARSALAENPNLSAARRQLARLLARRGDVRAAEALVDEGLRQSPGDALLQVTAVGIAQQAGGVEAALAAADRAAARPGAMPAAATLRGDVLMGANRPVEALQAFTAAAQHSPSVELTLRQVGALTVAQRADEGLALLRAWAARNPGDAQAHSVLGQLELRRDQTEAAMRHFRAAAEATPNDAVVINNLAWLLQEHGGEAGRAEARRFAERAFFLAPSAEIADTFGWILARSGEGPRGLPLLRQAAAAAAAANTPTAPGIAFRLAWTLDSLGQREEAARVLAPVLANAAPFPERGEAERLMSRLRGG